MQLRCEYDRILTDENGAAVLQFKVLYKKSTKELAAGIRANAGENGHLDITIEKPKKKRSGNANAYMWELVNRVAAVLKLPPRAVYRKCIIESGGAFEEFTVMQNNVDKIMSLWEKQGIGWIAERVDSGGDNTAIFNGYYGSSTYSGSQMSRLIESVIAECNALSIPTIPPKEIERLLGSWSVKNG